MNITFFDTERGRLAFYFDSYWGADRYRSPSSPTMGRSSLTTWKPKRDERGQETEDFEEEPNGNVDSYLVPHPGESLRSFRVRVNLASYINLIQPITDAYVDAVTGPVVRNLGEIEPFLASLDGRGRCWSDHVEEVARWCAVYGYCATVLDTPEKNTSASRAEEEALGVGLKASLVHPTAFAWLVIGDDGDLSEFAFCDAPYIPAQSGKQLVRFWIYTRETWALYQQEVLVSAGFGAARASLVGVKPVRNGKLPVPGKVPVIFAYFRQDTSSPTPRGVPLVGDACDVTRQIYNTLSWVEEIHRKTAFPFLAVPEAATGGQLEAPTQRKLGPSTAFGYNSASGAPGWIQPSAEQTKELRDHSMFLAACALRTTGLEVTSSDSSPDASGEALKVRSRDFDSRCARFARSLASFEREALGMAAKMLGLAPPAPATYPKRFTLPAPADDLARAILLMMNFGPKMGAVGITATMRAAIDAALSLSDEQINAIMEDVQETLARGDELGALQAEHEALKASHNGTKQMLGHVLAKNKAGELVTGNPLAPSAPNALPAPEGDVPAEA